MEADLRNAIGQFNKGIGPYDKIKLYDVEIEFSQEDRDTEETYDDEDEEDGDI